MHGFTTQPSTLNEWLARLGQSPLLVGQTLSAVKVEQSRLDGATVWAFSLLSAINGPAKPASGARP